jgi:nicotinamidase-related amidase
MIWDADEEVGILAEKSTFLKHEGLRRGTWGAEIVADLEYRDGDPVVEKKRFSAFYNTSLEQLLQRLNVRRLIVGGVRSDFCVESTVRDAFFRDYKVILVSDGTASYFPHFHEATLKVMNTVFAEVKNTEEIIAMLEHTG